MTCPEMPWDDLSGVNRDGAVGRQPGQHTSTNILCKFGS
jgi:hypothetical protein